MQRLGFTAQHIQQFIGMLKCSCYGSVSNIDITTPNGRKLFHQQICDERNRSETKMVKFLWQISKQGMVNATVLALYLGFFTGAFCFLVHNYLMAVQIRHIGSRGQQYKLWTSPARPQKQKKLKIIFRNLFSSHLWLLGSCLQVRILYVSMSLCNQHSMKYIKVLGTGNSFEREMLSPKQAPCFYAA